MIGILMLAWGFGPAGMFLLGFGAEVLEPEIALVVMGAIAFLLIAVLTLAVPALRRMKLELGDDRTRVPLAEALWGEPAVSGRGRLASEANISPHYYYPTDHSWQFSRTVEKRMHENRMFDRDGALSLEGFTGSGADRLERYRPLIEDGKTVVASPQKVYGPENNDLVLEVRKRSISKVILGGMPENLCVEAPLREPLEQGLRGRCGEGRHGWSPTP